MDDLLEQSAAFMARGVRDGLFTAGDLIEASLARAAHVQGLCNAFTLIDERGAMDAARRVDHDRRRGEALPPLAGVPIVVKDMTPTKGLPTTMGCSVVRDDLFSGDALIVSRLRNAGAILVAKSSTSELAFSSFTRSARYGATLNPWNRRRTAGGSSGGSAVAVATRVAPLAEGSDMGGSIRIPAAACGTVGFKPSLGRIPMTILPTPIDTISHFGPLAARVDDAVMFLAATAGPSDEDLLSQVAPFDTAACRPAHLKGLSLGLSVDLGYCSVDPDVERSIESAAQSLSRAGARIGTVALSWTRAAMDQWLMKWSALLALMDENYTTGDHSKMDADLVELIERASHTTSLELKRSEAYQKTMAVEMAKIMTDYDAILCPTNAITAPPVEERDSSYEVNASDGKLKAFDMTHPFNMLPSYPAISLPIGLASDGLPVGLQVVGRRYADEALLSIAGAIEEVIGRMPSPLSASDDRLALEVTE